MELLFITNEPEIAQTAVAAGVQRIFIDLEIEGKAERQRGLNAHLSTHTQADVARMRDAVPDATLLVRCNPPSDRSAGEVEAVLRDGADMLMLPMFHDVEEISGFVQLVGGRAKVVGLVETPAAFARLRQITATDHRPDEVYLGLNDLSLLMGLEFLMEPLAGGLVDHFCREARDAGYPLRIRWCRTSRRRLGSSDIDSIGACPSRLVARHPLSSVSQQRSSTWRSRLAQSTEA
jgi:citrate lyase beta subunit